MDSICEMASACGTESACEVASACEEGVRRNGGMESLGVLLGRIAEALVDVADRLSAIDLAGLAPCIQATAGPDAASMQAIDYAVQINQSLATVLGRLTHQPAGQAPLDVRAIVDDLPLDSLRASLTGQTSHQTDNDLDLF